MSIEELQAAVDQLSRSDRGHKVMRGILALLEDHAALSLDQEGQKAIIVLLCGAWGQYAGTARDMIRDRLDDPSKPA